MVIRAGAYLGTKSAAVGRTYCTKHCTNDDCRDGLTKRQTKIGTDNTDWDSPNMASHRPPEPEDVPESWGPLVLLVNAIDTLGFNAHLRIQPFLPLTQLAKEGDIMLHVSCLDHFHGIVIGHDAGMTSLDIFLLHMLLMSDLQVGLVAVNKITHRDLGRREELLARRGKEEKRKDELGLQSKEQEKDRQRLRCDDRIPMYSSATVE